MGDDRKVNVVELVVRAQAGDVGSYEQIVRNFQASAFGHAFYVLGDSYLAEDAVQDAFVEAYQHLGSLRTPEAFASWFGRIVATACDRMTRRKTLLTSSLEEAERLQDFSESPDDRIEREQQEREVHLAIQALPESLRIVTALYYIGGIRQQEVARYLGLSEVTVKKRLFDARKKLKEGIMSMAKRISEGAMPAERVSARVIAELVGRPQPLLVKDHPIRRLLDEIINALPGYELIESPEVEGREMYASIQEPYWRGAQAYQLDAKHTLRTQTTGATLRAIKGRQTPIRLLTAGRVFRAVREDELHLKVFHQADGICVAQDASLVELKETLKRLLSAVLGQVEIRFRDHDLGFLYQGMDVTASIGDKWESIAGCGLLRPDMLGEAGHDPKQVEGFAFGLGLERLAVLKFGLRSVDELWRPPYVQPS
jgi:RNA polymerase sigma factor (sigma-70 family)